MWEEQFCWKRTHKNAKNEICLRSRISTSPLDRKRVILSKSYVERMVLLKYIKIYQDIEPKITLLDQNDYVEWSINFL